MSKNRLLRALSVISLLALPLVADAQDKPKHRRKKPAAETSAPAAETAPAPEPEAAPPPAPPPPPSVEPTPTANTSAAVSLSVDTSAEAAPDSEEPPTEGPLYERGGMSGIGLVLGAKVGGGFSQPFGKLGSSFLTELEVGYNLPVLQRALEVFVSGGYTQPKAEGKNIQDTRLPAASSYKLTQQEAMVSLGLLYRLRLSTNLIRPYASAGPRIYMMRTKISGKSGSEPFGNNQETATKVGAFGALGCEIHLGPGAVLLEASMTWAKIDGFVLRNTSAGAATVSLGYRLFL